MAPTAVATETVPEGVQSTKPDAATLSKAQKLPDRYFTPREIESHNIPTDLWVSWLGNVYNLTSLAQVHAGDELLQPILVNGGRDISHWFDPTTGDLKTHKHPVTGYETPYTPHGRFVHVPPLNPSSNWMADVETPWWLDHGKYYLGKLSVRTRKLKIINTLTKDDHVMEACSEEPLSHIQERYMRTFNAHAKGYMWKRLGNLLDMSATLEQNGILDDGPNFDMVGIDEDDWIPAIHIYFSDDLTVS